MATSITGILHQVNLVIDIEDHERESVLGNVRSVCQEQWLLIHCNRHPVAVMRAMAWRCPHYMSGTAADAYIYSGFPIGDPSYRSFGLLYARDGLFASIEPSNRSEQPWQLVVPWHVFCFEMERQRCSALADVQQFFFNEEFGVVHLLDTQERQLEYGLDRYVFGYPVTAAGAAVAIT